MIRGEPALCFANNSVAEYREAIVQAETEGHEFAYIQWRISPFFKPDDTIGYIAEKRFGEGDPNVDEYFNEHTTRRQVFYQALRGGAIFRELYPRDRLLRYVRPVLMQRTSGRCRPIM